MMRYIYQFIDDIPMYRAALYALIGIVVTAFILSILGQLSFSLFDMTISLAVIVAVSYGANRLFALVFSASTNKESSLITGLIIFLLLFPVGNAEGLLYAALTAGIAQASKYIIAIRGKHIFNPAAIAVALSSLLGLSGAVWWVGSPLLIPAVVILGGLIVLKVREVPEVISYLVAILFVSIISSIVTGHDIGAGLSALFISGPVLFAGTIMLTEPLTAPGTRRQKIGFSILVGTLTGFGLSWVSKPEIALLVGNLIAFCFGPARLLRLKFVSVNTIAPGIIEVLLEPRSQLRFQPGQYLELSVPHRHADSRGVRRVFSIASSPQSNQLRLAMNQPAAASTYKQALSQLKAGSMLSATRIAGDFVLPNNPDTPLVFIAGGIGITPFRSMIETMLQANEKRNVTLLYGVKDEASIVYADLLIRARNELGMRIIPVISQPSPTWQGESGIVNAQLIQRLAISRPGMQYYISGSNTMVESIKTELKALSIPRTQIHTDHFTGY